MSDAPSPENNLILRQLAEIRRENRETQERQARVIELLGRTNQKIDGLVARMERGAVRGSERYRPPGEQGSVRHH